MSSAPPIYYDPGLPGRYASQTPAPPYSRPGTAPVSPVKVRGKRPDDEPERRAAPKAALLTLPPPEQLGIGTKAAVAAAEVDWNDVYRRLRVLNSRSSHLEAVPEGFRFVCELRTTDPNRPYRVEGQGATEADAVRSALARAEQWARGR
jgi:hypothetical protein